MKTNKEMKTKKTIFLMDNQAHMTFGGGQVFVSQIERAIRTKMDVHVKLFNSRQIYEDPIYKSLYNPLERLLLKIENNFTRSNQVLTVLSIFKKALYLGRLRIASRHIKRSSYYDLIISNDVSDLYILDKRKVKADHLVIILHNPYIDKILQGYSRVSFFRKIFNEKYYFEKVVKKNNTVIISLNPKQNKIIRDKFDVKVLEIHNGVDTTIFSPVLNKTNGEKLLLYVGRLEENQKRVSRIIEHMTYIDKEAKLILIGQGSSASFFKELINMKGLDSRVSLIGRVNEETKLQYYRKATIFVSGSENEGLSYSYLEAMASGLPIVSYVNGSTDVLIRNGYNGFAVSTREEYAECVNKILNSPEIKDTLSRNSRLTIKENFSLDKMTQKYLSLIKELLQ